MQPVTIYTRPFCPYCARAISLLQKKGVEYTEFDDAAYDPERKKEMVKRANGRSTFPQIFIGDEHIGGCDDLVALDAKGQLDQKLNA